VAFGTFVRMNFLLGHAICKHFVLLQPVMGADGSDISVLYVFALKLSKCGT
jgi:hypothetical protein